MSGTQERCGLMNGKAEGHWTALIFSGYKGYMLYLLMEEGSHTSQKTLKLMQPNYHCTSPRHIQLVLYDKASHFIACHVGKKKRTQTQTLMAAETYEYELHYSVISI